MTRTLAWMFVLLLVGGSAAAQKKTTKLTMKTTRLHIDGFMKSKSGAV